MQPNSPEWCEFLSLVARLTPAQLQVTSALIDSVKRERGLVPRYHRTRRLARRGVLAVSN